ncbi:hypothetical protein PROFUN_05136 [Planoprotostelium fungivorum]|uniref:ACB domain-containing protein n=1 Tax=Planoprotostelium fungivorum TaxID=1890364 RepID=A0A2P6NRS8_9EUKA|nr:hypothetical protein PROFUN_05136 [Planoprotostelium fungivorum]
MTEAQFKKASSIIQGLPKDGPIQPSDNDKLKFYGFYKQATEGDNTTSRPGMLDFVGKYKWDAWAAHKGKSKDEAYKGYVDAFLETFQKYSSEPDSAKYIEESVLSSAISISWHLCLPVVYNVHFAIIDREAGDTFIESTHTDTHTHTMTQNPSQSGSVDWNERASAYFDMTGQATRIIGEIAVAPLKVTQTVLVSTFIHLKQFTSDSIVHDNAAGPAVEVQALKSIGGKDLTIEVTDFSADMINLAQWRITENAWNNVNARIMDAQVKHNDADEPHVDLPLQSLSYPDDHFSHSITNFGIVPPDSAAVARELYRTLRPGGVAVATTWKHSQPMEIAVKAATIATEEAGYLESQLRAVGFGTVEVKVIQGYAVYGRKFGEDYNPVYNFLARLMGDLGLNEEEKKVYLDIVKEEVYKTNTENGAKMNDIIAWVAYATKHNDTDEPHIDLHLQSLSYLEDHFSLRTSFGIMFPPGVESTYLYFLT